MEIEGRKMGFIDGIPSRGFNLIAERSENVMNLTCFFIGNTWIERVESTREHFKHYYDWSDKFIQKLISTIFRHGQWRCWCIQCLSFPCCPSHVTTVHRERIIIEKHVSYPLNPFQYLSFILSSQSESSLDSFPFGSSSNYQMNNYSNSF